MAIRHFRPAQPRCRHQSQVSVESLAVLPYIDTYIRRNPDTLEAVEYYFKATAGALADRLVIVMDPMLATANSAVASRNTRS